MALRTAAVTVEDTATRLDVFPDRLETELAGGFSLLVSNESDVDIRVGGPDVTLSGPTRGLLIVAGAERSINVRDAAGGVYAIAAAAADVTIAQEGV